MFDLDIQNTVALEAICVMLITLIIIAAYKRWNLILYASSILTTIAFYSTWSFLMASASLMVYGPATVLLWTELDKSKNTDIKEKNFSLIRKLSWLSLATGVSFIIAKNIYNIVGYLHIG